MQAARVLEEGETKQCSPLSTGCAPEGPQADVGQEATIPRTPHAKDIWRASCSLATTEGSVSKQSVSAGTTERPSPRSPAVWSTQVGDSQDSRSPWLAHSCCPPSSAHLPTAPAKESRLLRLHLQISHSASHQHDLPGLTRHPTQKESFPGCSPLGIEDS